MGTFYYGLNDVEQCGKDFIISQKECCKENGLILGRGGKGMVFSNKSDMCKKVGVGVNFKKKQTLINELIEKNFSEGDVLKIMSDKSFIRGLEDGGFAEEDLLNNMK